MGSSDDHSPLASEQCTWKSMGLINPAASTGGSLADKAATIFRIYDISGRNHLDHEAMMSALNELGVLSGLTVKRLGEILCLTSDHYGLRSRSYSLLEFISFYERLAHYQAKVAREERIRASSRHALVPDGAEKNELLRRVYDNYCKYTVGQGRLIYDEHDPKMSSTQFVKLCQDLGLVQPVGPLNVVTIDLIFHKCKPMGGRRFSYPHYLRALAAIAEDSGHNVFELISLLGMQIKPRATFVAPQPMGYRQGTAGGPPDDSASEDHGAARSRSPAVLPPIQTRPTLGSPRAPDSPVAVWATPSSGPQWLQDLVNKVSALQGEVVELRAQEAVAKAEAAELRKQMMRTGCGAGAGDAALASTASTEEQDQLLNAFIAGREVVTGSDMAKIMLNVKRRLAAAEVSRSETSVVTGTDQGPLCASLEARMTACEAKNLEQDALLTAQAAQLSMQAEAAAAAAAVTAAQTLQLEALAAALANQTAPIYVAASSAPATDDASVMVPLVSVANDDTALKALQASVAALGDEAAVQQAALAKEAERTAVLQTLVDSMQAQVADHVPRLTCVEQLAATNKMTIEALEGRLNEASAAHVVTAAAAAETATTSAATAEEVRVLKARTDAASTVVTAPVVVSDDEAVNALSARVSAVEATSTATAATAAATADLAQALDTRLTATEAAASSAGIAAAAAGDSAAATAQQLALFRDQHIAELDAAAEAAAQQTKQLSDRLDLTATAAQAQQLADRLDLTATAEQAQHLSDRLDVTATAAQAQQLSERVDAAATAVQLKELSDRLETALAALSTGASTAPAAAVTAAAPSSAEVQELRSKLQAVQAALEEKTTVLAADNTAARHDMDKIAKDMSSVAEQVRKIQEAPPTDTSSFATWGALQEAEKKLTDRMDIKAQVIVKMAQQVDHIQNAIVAADLEAAAHADEMQKHMDEVRVNLRSQQASRAGSVFGGLDSMNMDMEEQAGDDELEGSGAGGGYEQFELEQT